MNTQNNAQKSQKPEIQAPKPSLAARLIQFGLDPRNWILQEQSTDTWLIQNRDCDELCLLGKSIQRESRWEWAQIEVLVS